MLDPKSFGVALLCILVLDAIWLGLVAGNLYKNDLKDLLRLSGDSFKPLWPAAIAVYVLLAIGFAMFVVPNTTSVLHATVLGAILGVIIYGVYDFTNYALLAKWTLKVTIIDVVWGGVLGGITSAVTKWFMIKF